MNRVTLRKGQLELERGLICLGAFSWRGRKRGEARLPNLLNDIRALVDGHSQTDSSFKITRLYTRLSAAEVRQQLITQKGYTEDELPTTRTLSTKLNELGYHLRKVAKSKPKKKRPETDAIFEQVHQINAVVDQADEVLRLSMDAKAPVKIGDFSRGGVSRVEVAAADHDFKPTVTLTPWGFLLPKYDDLFLYLSTSKITSDFIVDRLSDLWCTFLRPRLPQVKLLVLNQDNGPENHSRRTQFLKRIVEFTIEHHLMVRLAYYPPYHSKYNPVERSFGVLENHWNGALLDEVETALKFAESMTWKGKHPISKKTRPINTNTPWRASQSFKGHGGRMVSILPAGKSIDRPHVNQSAAHRLPPRLHARPARGGLPSPCLPRLQRGHAGARAVGGGRGSGDDSCARYRSGRSLTGIPSTSGARSSAGRRSP